MDETLERLKKQYSEAELKKLELDFIFSRDDYTDRKIVRGFQQKFSIFTLTGLLEIPMWKIKTVKLFGNKTIKRITEVIKFLGFSFKMN